MRLPEFGIVDILDGIPKAGFASTLLPAAAQMAVVEAKHLRRKPRGHVHAIGDMPDGDLVFLLAGVKSFPHRARNFAVQTRHRICAPRKPQTEHGHARSEEHTSELQSR